MSIYTQTISFLLDSKNYFMPRYLAINEIKTVLTFGKEPYHQVSPSSQLVNLFGRRKCFWVENLFFVLSRGSTTFSLNLSSRSFR